jgi:triosephosphate isomerase
MIFINFKTYKKGTGANAAQLAKIIENVSNQTHVKIILAVQALDVKEIVEMTKLEVWVQSIDPVDPGAHTGAILPEAVKEDGAIGTFLNHSEKKLDDYNLLSKSINQASRAGLKTLVFAGGINELRKVVGLKPTFVAYEPPELVGSRDKSVAAEKPEVIKEAAKIAKSARLPLIVGAGIKSAEDVRVSLRLGAMGVAVASDVVKADDPEKELLDLVKGLEG